MKRLLGLPSLICLSPGCGPIPPIADKFFTKDTLRTGGGGFFFGFFSEMLRDRDLSLLAGKKSDPVATDTLSVLVLSSELLLGYNKA